MSAFLAEMQKLFGKSAFSRGLEVLLNLQKDLTLLIDLLARVDLLGGVLP